MVLIAGGQAKLDFSITGDPAPTVQWLQNGEPLADGDGIATVKADVSFHLLTTKIIVLYIGVIMTNISSTAYSCHQHRFTCFWVKWFNLNL